MYFCPLFRLRFGHVVFLWPPGGGWLAERDLSQLLTQADRQIEREREE